MFTILNVQCAAMPYSVTPDGYVAIYLYVYTIDAYTIDAYKYVNAYKCAYVYVYVYVHAQL
jgi:hypothetical protein